MTETQALAAIEQTKSLPKQTAIVRLFAISQLFYRQPVGEAAGDRLHALIGVEATNALFFLMGFSNSGNLTAEKWERLVPVE